MAGHRLGAGAISLVVGLALLRIARAQEQTLPDSGLIIGEVEPAPTPVATPEPTAPPEPPPAEPTPGGG